MIENVEKRRVIHLFTTWSSQGHKRGASADIASGFLKNIIIFSPNLIACELQKSTVYLNKPVQVGFKILEDSKHQMYSFHYEFMKPKYGNNVELLYMDTDSFLYNIRNHDFYSDLKQLSEENSTEFDTSNYETDNPYGVKRINAQKLGSIKDELGGKIMTKFVALRAKCYAYEVMDGTNCKKAKGVQRRVAAGLTFEEYKSCLTDTSFQIYKDQMHFKSDGHVIYTDIITKIALNGADTKRFIMEDGIHTRAWGNKCIELLLNNNNPSD